MVELNIPQVGQNIPPVSTTPPGPQSASSLIKCISEGTPNSPPKDPPKSQHWSQH
jgi:hypothetical protein